MCNYCKCDIEKGLFPREIVCKDFNVNGKSNISDAYINGQITYNRNLRLLSSVYTFENKNVLSYSVFTTDNPLHDDVDICLEIEIKYCPMCGRKL